MNAEITVPVSLDLSLCREKKRPLVSWHQSARRFDTARAAVIGTLRSAADKSPHQSEKKTAQEV